MNIASFLVPRPVTNPRPPDVSQPKPDAALIRKTVERSPGWNLLTPVEQKHLDTLLGGTENKLSLNAQADLSRVLPEGYEQLTPTGQAALLRLFFDRVWLPFTVNSYRSNPLPVNTTPKIVKVEEVPNVDFPGFRGTAIRRWVSFDGVTFPIYEAKSPPQTPGINRHTLAEVLEALARMPAPLRASIHELYLNPVVNPDDAVLTKKQEAFLAPPAKKLDAALDRQPGLSPFDREAVRQVAAEALKIDLNAAPKKTEPFHTYAQATRRGIVTVFPLPWTLEQNKLAPTLIHEVGHVLTFNKFGTSASAPKWQLWKESEAKDGFYPSSYAASSIWDDAAEALSTYFMYAGQKGHEELQHLFAARYQRLAELLGKDVTDKA